jgi:uncharacterized membrane protein YesL
MYMKFIDTRLYQWLDTVSNFLFLNVLWFIASLPLITIFPATAAIFAVTRDWVRGKEIGVVEPFLRYFRENFFQSLVTGVVWTLLGLLLILDIYFFNQVNHWSRTPLLSVIAITMVVYLAMTVYLFPVIVNYRTGWLRGLKYSFILAIGSPLTTLLCLLTIAIAGVIVYFLPVSFIMLPSFIAYLLYRLCQRTFAKWIDE